MQKASVQVVLLLKDFVKEKIMFNPVALVPHYNHSSTVTQVVQDLLALGLPVIVVDDASQKEQKSALETLAILPNVSVIYRSKNGGKGAAVKTGLKAAKSEGFSHAVQVDADGQHHLEDIQKMLVKAQQYPNAVICGKPIYGDDAPKSRLYGRKITNFWIAINTCSLAIEDGMCGFRLYPLESVVTIIEQVNLGERMDFDIEILVHCHWERIPMVWIATPIKYEQNGISHFRGWVDNWLISKMHAKLFFGMLKRVVTGKI